MDLLRSTRGVLSGSAALLMVTNLSFAPGDLDFYMPASQEQTSLAMAGKRLGFTLRRSSARTYENNMDIKRVHELVKGQKKMNIIVTKGENAVAAIFQFHTTVVMNMLTAAGLYCAYPDLTLKSWGVANLTVLLKDSSSSRRTRACYEKYRDRGVRIEKRVNNFPGLEHHECYVGAECPMTVRSTSDGKGLYAELFPPTVHERERREIDKYTTIWMLGGPMCSQGNTYCNGFTKSIPACTITVSMIPHYPDIGLAYLSKRRNRCS
ncbi:hypothetical protein C8F04DRAFT_962484 [Mycena alexandri]|uniref:Uncharacterized protein n=1 Tax=Mycena alexandri TaxID=1745969 RepID=A0AAD6X2I8_9AGAR|nr:hypothetical protein C8F04DRAFT_962484 [Mycena alexandri]